MSTEFPNANVIQWQEITCPLCHSSDEEELLVAPCEGRGRGTGGEQRMAAVFSFSPLAPDLSPLARGGYRLVRCRQCTMTYLNPRPDEESIGQFYPDEYEPYEAKGQHRTGGVRRYLERLVRSHFYGYPPPLHHWSQKILATIARLWLNPRPDSMTALPYRGNGRLLDFGCGSGSYLRRMREMGWQVTGMDFSSYAARQVTDRFGIPVVVGTLPHAEIKRESFDVITMGAVLEHVHWPHRIIEAATEALCPGGLLVISVPNIASWGFEHFGQDWWPLELPRHLLHFSPTTLRCLAEMHGLQVIDQRMLARTGWMRRSFANARRHSSSLLARVSGMRIVPSLLTRWSVWTQKADCLLLIARRPRRTRTIHVGRQAA